MGIVILLLFAAAMIYLFSQMNAASSGCTTEVRAKLDSIGFSSGDCDYYYPIVRYEYQGQTYVGSLNGGGEYASRKRLLQDYPEGATFRVYIDPNNPGMATKNAPVQKIRR